MAQTHGFTYGAIGAICSGLAKACDRQMRSEESSLFSQLADYFTKHCETPGGKSFSSLEDSIDGDIANAYPAAASRAEEERDRGAMRCIAWGRKVTAIHKSLLARYGSKGDALLEGNNLYVCEACGFVAIASETPGLCPICKAPASRFTKIS